MQPDQQVVTGEAVPLELRIAGAGSRGIAALIDIALVMVMQVVILVIVIATTDNTTSLATLALVTEVLLVLGYPVVLETLWRGRTVGKATMGLRVVRDDGGPIRFRHAFVRGLVGVVLEKPGITLGFCALFFMLVTSHTKRLGDIAAGTIVLQDRVPGRVDAPVAMPPELAGWATSLELSGIDDALALRLRQYLTRAPQLVPAARAALEQQLLGEIAGRVGRALPATSGWTIISAVLAERRRRAFLATQPAASPWENPALTGDGSAPSQPPLPPSGFAPPT